MVFTHFANLLRCAAHFLLKRMKMFLPPATMQAARNRLLLPMSMPAQCG